MSSLTPLFFATAAGAAIAGAVLGHGVRRSVPWLLRLRDRRLPFAHPWMEAVTALAFVAVVARFGPTPPTMGLLVFVAVLVAIAAADYRAKLIPDRLSLGGTLAGLAFAAWVPERLLATPLHVWALDLAGLPTSGPWAGLAVAAGGGLFGLLMLEAIRLGFGAVVGTEVMGMGDSKLAMLIGTFLGPLGVLGTVLLSFFLGVVHGAIVLRFSGQPHSPFGPPLAAAAVAVLVAGSRLAEAVAAFQSLILSLPLGLLAAVYTVLSVIAVLLLLRTRRRAADYEEMVEADYQRIEDELES